MIRRTLIDLNPDGLKYYQFIINLDKCNANSVFKMITRINEAKTLIKILLYFAYSFISDHITIDNSIIFAIVMQNKNLH